MIRSLFLNTLVLLLTGLAVSSCLRDAPETPKKILVQDNWTLRKAGSDSVFPAQVPGCVHLDLLANNLIPDPYYADNEHKVQWIEHEDWIYLTTFRADKQLLGFEHIDLVFDGLDTYASVFLNDSLIITADNMFRKWKVDVKDILHSGHNELKVVFNSPVRVNRDKASALPYVLPDERAFSRKAPYMFGWDWGPRLVTSGIWKPVYFEAWDKVRIDDWQVTTDSLGSDLARLRMILKVSASDSMTLNCNFKVSVKERTTTPVHLVKGENTLEIPFTIEDPKRWWVHNLGEPFLYDFSVSFAKGEKVLERLRNKFGIRTIELCTGRDGTGGSFYFRLNGEPVFMKGANYIPQDNFPTRVTWERHEKLIRAARDANMNMIRVWGGGIYEEDDFYKLCDEYGILVWQDFMFACTMYPGDSSFVANVREEAVQQVTRLRNHPCLALWCGNNEVDEGWHNWGWQKQFNYSPEDSALIWSHYENVFHEVLPEAVNQFDGVTNYWPSSPKHGWGRQESLTDGDMHYWGVWWGREPFEIYNIKVGRFMSEYGFQAYPSLSTLEDVIPEGERHLGSNALLNHQKHPFGEEVIRESMERWYPVPGKEKLENYVYLSQLTQAHGLKTAMEAHRRSMPYCMGTLYWQLNDCWPAISWSGTDYNGRWKALHYIARRAYGDIIISLVSEDGKLNAFLVNDLNRDVPGMTVISLMDLSGKIIREDTLGITASKNSSVAFYTENVSQIIRDHHSANVFLDLLFVSVNDTLARNNWYFVPPRELELVKPEIRAEVTEKGDKIQIILTSGSLAKDLCLHFKGHEGRFSDNYFDLVPGITRKIIFFPEDREKMPAPDDLELRCLNDLIQY